MIATPFIREVFHRHGVAPYRLHTPAAPGKVLVRPVPDLRQVGVDVRRHRTGKDRDRGAWALPSNIYMLFIYVILASIEVLVCNDLLELFQQVELHGVGGMKSLQP